MRVTSTDLKNDVHSADSACAFWPEPHYRFTRQPVKYHRHHNNGPRHSDPGCAPKQALSTSRSCPGSADSSRSSSPEPGTQRLSEHMNENSGLSQQAPTAAESKEGVPLSTREVVEYMLGLDSTFPTNVETTAKYKPDLNLLRQSADRGRVVGHSSKSPHSVEHIMTSPAQRILSGLKLRRSHSGKDEQLFV